VAEAQADAAVHGLGLRHQEGGHLCVHHLEHDGHGPNQENSLRLPAGPPPPLGPIVIGLAPPVCTIVLIPIDTGGLAVPEHVGAAWSHLTWSSSSLSGVDSDGVAR
jgi:hypothetical protein